MKKFYNHRRILAFLMCIATLGMLVACGKTNNTGEQLPLKVTCVDDLEGKVIGVQLGTTGDIYVTDYEGDDAGTKVERYNKGNDAIQALKQDKVDAVVIDEEPAKAFAAHNKELTILEEEFADEDYAICIAKGNSGLENKINDALDALTKDGTLEKIKKNYTGTDEEKGSFKYESQDISRPNGTLVMATNAYFKPYEYYDAGKITGLDVDMMRAVCDILGMTLKIEDMEFDSIINAVASGKADVGVAGMTVTEDRLKNINFTNSYTNARQVIIVKDPNAVLDNDTLIDKFKQNFIQDDRWQYLSEGLLNTLIITVFAVLIGIVLGFLIAMIRSNHDMNGGLKIPNAICQVYLTVVRGTPIVVQLLIIYYVIFASVNVNKILAAVIAFGLNSAAYIAEIVRSGIMSIDAGQFEAGRSLGLNYQQTMRKIIMPQAIKNILPALANEFIVLVKETSVSGYIGLADLTKGGDIIRSITYEPLLPLLAVAVIYLVVVFILQTLVNRFERRLRNEEK